MCLSFMDAVQIGEIFFLFTGVQGLMGVNPGFFFCTLLLS
jgi:hypothetical protein